MEMIEPAEQLRHTALEIAEKADEILGQIERMTECDVIITLKPFEVPTYTVKKMYFSESAFQSADENGL